MRMCSFVAFAFTIAVASAACDLTLQPTTTFATDLTALVANATGDVTVCFVSGGAYSGCSDPGVYLSLPNGGSMSVDGKGATITCAGKNRAFVNSAESTVSTISNLNAVSTSSPYQDGSVIRFATGTLTITNLQVTGTQYTAVAAYNATMNIVNSHFASGGMKAANYGGAVLYEESSTGKINDTVFDGNSQRFGGAVAVKARCSVTFTYCDFLNNYSGSNGGALYVSGSVTAVDCTFTNNTAGKQYPSSGNGAAISCLGGCTATLSNIVASENVALASGGIIHATDYSVVSVANSTLYSNTASGSGGVFAFTRSNLTLTSVSMQYNQAGGYGGAVYFSYYATLVCTNSLVESNVAGAGGGGMRIYFNTYAYITDTDINYNTAATHGGGVMFEFLTKSYIEGGSISHNTATNYGGGIYWYDNCSGNLTGVDMRYNTAATAGGAYVRDSDMNLDSVSLRANSASTWGGAFYMSLSYVTSVNTCVYNNHAPENEGPAAYMRLSSRWYMTNSTSLLYNTLALKEGAQAVDSVSRVAACVTPTSASSSVLGFSTDSMDATTGLGSTASVPLATTQNYGTTESEGKRREWFGMGGW